MPRGNRTGPLGQGPMTGRAMGYCARFSNPGFMNPGPGFRRGFGFGRGFGQGLGFGRGRGGRRFGFDDFWRYPYPQAMPYDYPYTGPAPDPSSFQLSKEDELQHLKQESEILHQQMEDISKRIEELEKKKKKD